MLCWMNGQYIESDELRISPMDHGFLYGLGFFETFRTYRGEVVFLYEHYVRLCEGLQEYRIAMPYTLDELEGVIKKLNEQDGKDGYFRINVSAGVHDIGLAPQQYPEPNVIVFRKSLAVAPRGTEKQAQWLETARNSPEQVKRHKSHHYGNNVSARLELPNLTDFEGFFLTKNNLVAEGITSNIFWVKNDILYTPSIDLGILPGITRQIVLQLAAVLEVSVREGVYYKEELERADECFITNSVQELVPISKVGHVSFAGAQGLMYQKLQLAYEAEISHALRRD